MGRLSTVARLWLGSLFVYSAGLKLAHYDQADSLVKGYGVVPKPAAAAIGFTLPWAELLTAILLFLGRFYPVGPLLGASLGASFAYSSSTALRRKVDVPCGCTGRTRDRVDRTTLVRALAITSTSSSLLVLGARRHGYGRFPPMMVVAVGVASLLPGGREVYRRMRQARMHQQHMRHNQRIVAQLTELLATPPPERPLTDPTERQVVQEVTLTEI